MTEAEGETNDVVDCAAEDEAVCATDVLTVSVTSDDCDEEDRGDGEAGPDNVDVGDEDAVRVASTVCVTEAVPV